MELKYSLMASKSEVKQLKEILEKESTICTNLQSELEKTLKELQRVNDTAAEAIQEREAITTQLHLAQSDAAAIAQAARVRQSELQSEALESTVRERRALYFAAALERSLLFAVSRGAECTARLGLLTMKRDDGSTTSNEVRDLHAFHERRSRAQLLAAIAVIARSASHTLARRCFSQWGRVCYDARSQRMACVRRENRERRRELTLWCDNLSIVKSGGVWRDAGQRAAAVGDMRSTSISKAGTPPLINTNTINNTNSINTVNNTSNTSRGGSHTVVDTAEADTVMTQLDAKEDSPALLDLKSILTREPVNTELLLQLESELESRSHPAAV
ncbi:hypothetical protein LSM04_001613 [Trypanosoma melophagium]|uniref:uncharacterized protein n=1 Tax=Trypanosoma melophagium TaxID=715481 RepID=UPI003519E6E6|nr:hypothetical protein LSM04_001613 [Trypanosoma melophagium]